MWKNYQNKKIRKTTKRKGECILKVRLFILREDPAWNEKEKNWYQDHYWQWTNLNGRDHRQGNIWIGLLSYLVGSVSSRKKIYQKKRTSSSSYCPFSWIGRDYKQAYASKHSFIHGYSFFNLGMFICNNDYAIVMEYMEGGSLFDYLHIKGYKLTESKIVQICRHVAIAMCYLHSKDIVHCDLKSSNLLLDRYWKIKISDFGLSRIIDPNTNKQQRSTRLGTPQWMAPEVMRGEKYQPACDVYSFGMILW